MSFPARGTRNLFGQEARELNQLIQTFSAVCDAAGYEPFIPSALAPVEIFLDKVGPDLGQQMYRFQDRKGRELCLTPEVTGVVQRLYNDKWKKLPKPVRLYYATRCYRYERPQKGRYREFWQFGIECLGGKAPEDRNEVIDLLRQCLDQSGVDYRLVETVTRGLGYYVEDGFEAEVDSLEAQKQIAGGGRYEEGVGFAIGLDRLIIGRENEAA